MHYVSYGTPGGEYGRCCRAAVITRVGAWREVSRTPMPEVAGRPRRARIEEYDPTALALTVLNPGTFHNDAVRHAPYPQPGTPDGGTWHRLDECRHEHGLGSGPDGEP